MKARSLSSRILVASALVLVAFGAASFGLLYRAQSQLAERAIASLLKNNAFALSTLVSARPNGQFEFEITPLAISNYGNDQSTEFFRFIRPTDGQVLRESSNAPSVQCGAKNPGVRQDRVTAADHVYRIASTLFRPEPDDGLPAHQVFERAYLCLVVGVDEAPYRALVLQTVYSVIPVLLLLVLAALGMLLVLVRSLTRDLSQLTHVLQTADFSATHAFPRLPNARTAEVGAVVDKLREVHQQAADVYRDMWLFLGRAAHQLKTPVTAIQATLQVLLRRKRSPEELIAGLTDLVSAVDHMSALTQKLISSSRISYQEMPERIPVELEEFFVGQLKLFHSRAAERGIQLVLERESAQTVFSNVALMADLFGNLLENAILYSPFSSTVSIGWKPAGAMMRITVRDQGAGFPPAVQGMLFEPFVRGDERLATGSGLGLSIARKTARLLGGEVILEESGHAGSVLAVTLPKELGSSLNGHEPRMDPR